MEHDQDKMKSRREFLKTTGKFALYTPPVLMLMSKSSHANFTKSNGCHTNPVEPNNQSSNNGSHGGFLQELLYKLSHLL